MSETENVKVESIQIQQRLEIQLNSLLELKIQQNQTISRQEETL